MRELFALAGRNVFRNRRRTVLNVIALTVGIWIMVLGMGWVEGYHTYLFQAVIDFDTGDLQVLDDDYLDRTAMLPLDLVVSPYGRAREVVSRIRGVSAVSGRIDFSLELSNGSSSNRLLGRAIDARWEREVTELEEYVEEGAYLENGPGVLIGRPVADRLGLAVGDTAFLMAMDSRGRRNVVDVPVAGVFRFGYPAMDERIAFVDLASAAELLAMKDQVTRLVARAEPGRRARSVISQVNNALAEELDNGEEFAAHSWRTFAQTTVRAVRMDTFSFWVILVILFLLIVLGILNSMSMSAHERTGEMATVRAIGMRRSSVTTLLMAEAAVMCLMAALCAIALTVPFVVWLEQYGVNIGAMMPEDLPIPFGERFHADFRLWHYLLAIGVACGVAVAGSIIPGRRAASVNIAAALQGKVR